MVNYIYYGNGECYVDDNAGKNARGIQIHYRGSANLESLVGDGFVLMDKNNRILIFPLRAGGRLGRLFNYTGTMVISKVIMCDAEANIMTSGVKKIADYANLMATHNEDMDLAIENLTKSTLGGRNAKKSTGRKTISGLHTSEQSVRLLTKNGKRYTGSFHINIDSNQIMSGEDSSEDSEVLTSYKNIALKRGRAMKSSILRRRDKNLKPATPTPENVLREGNKK